MNVILLTHDSKISRALANLIKDSDINLTKVIIIRKINSFSNPKPVKKPGALQKAINRIRQKIRSFQTSSKVKSAHRAEEHFRQEANSIIHDYLSEKNLPPEHPKVEYVYTEDIQSQKIIDLLKEDQPDLCVVYGTPILRAPILSIPKIGTINAHTSILPEYRGSRSEFFQCYNQQYDHVGVTFHFVDTGVDTGGILHQHKTEPGSIPEPQVLRAKNTVATLTLFPEIIKKVLGNQFQALPQGKGVTPTYRYREMTYEKRMELYKRIGKEANL
jgi:methionyl-tRNA formyltransferase